MISSRIKTSPKCFQNTTPQATHNLHTLKADRLDEVIAPLWRKWGTLEDWGKFAIWPYHDRMKLVGVGAI